jgi:hypothetical protein
MASRRWLLSALALALAAGPVSAQAKGKHPLEEAFKNARREVPEGNFNEQFNKMRNGNVALDPPSEADRTLLENVARVAIYPVTHFELYTTPEAEKSELVPRPEERTVAKLLNDLRGKLVVVSPGDGFIPGPKIDFAREFGVAAVKAINEVLEKADKPIIRYNAIRALAVVAESGAPAVTDKLIELLQKKDDKTMAAEVLYAALQGAEHAIAMYDPARSADAQKWVTRDKFFALVSLVDDVVQKVPAVVAEKTFQPDKPNTGTLVTDPKAAPKPTTLTPEQVATVQAFRLQAVRALSEVKTDVVYDSKREKQRRTVLTLARVAVGDTSVVPPPTFKETGAAVIGLANATPTHEDLDAGILGAVIARGVSGFVADKASGERVGEGGPQATHWKLAGARMKAVFTAWDATLNSPRAKMAKADKDMLRELGQLAVTSVFDPLSKQSDAGVVTGLKKDAIDEWYSKKVTGLKDVAPLFKNTTDSNVTLKK